MKLAGQFREMLGTLSPAFIRSRQRGDPPEVQRWIRRGRPVPAPATIKLSVLRCYAQNFKPGIFVETGTYQGDTVYALRNEFRKLYTIELSHELYERARARLETAGNITPLEGDSTAILPRVLKEINEPCLFWLDGHYSGGPTAKGDVNCPLLRELACILSHPVKRHVILMDDARLFGKVQDYPTVAELTEQGRAGGYRSELHCDMLCLTPAESPPLAAQIRALIE